MQKQIASTFDLRILKDWRYPEWHQMEKSANQQFSAALTFFKILFKLSGRFMPMQHSNLPLNVQVFYTFSFGIWLGYIVTNLLPDLNNILKKVTTAENYYLYPPQVVDLSFSHFFWQDLKSSLDRKKMWLSAILHSCS